MDAPAEKLVGLSEEEIAEIETRLSGDVGQTAGGGGMPYLELTVEEVVEPTNQKPKRFGIGRWG